MKTVTISENISPVSQIGIGCMRIPQLSIEEVQRLIDSSMDCGINFFDHADIYGAGKSEEVFGQALSKAKREQMVIQSKCAIRPGICFDFSKDYIISSVDGILKRLQTDYLDILLLHRPDALVEPEEVAEAFDQLYKEGKVKNFGVSNHNPMQIELLNAYCEQKIKVNQIQYSIAHCPTIDAGLNVNMENAAGIDRDDSVIAYSRLHKIQLQAWSPFQYGMFKGTFIGNELFPELNKVMTRLAEKYQVTENAIAIAWILRHPAKMQAIVGTTNLERIIGISKAADITLTREEWYELYMAAGKTLP